MTNSKIDVNPIVVANKRIQVLKSALRRAISTLESVKLEMDVGREDLDHSIFKVNSSLTSARRSLENTDQLINEKM